MATTYRVRAGDTMFAIARRYGATVGDLLALNSINDPDNLRAGQQLIIPTGGVPGLIPTLQQQAGSTGSRTIRGLRYVIATNRRQYRRGDQVQITFIKCNQTNQPVTLRYNTSQRFDIAAVRNNREVWRWSDDRVFTPVMGTDVLRRGDCRVYTATWDLRNRQGNYVALDTFNLRAYNVARGYANQYVQTSIEVVSGQQPQPPDRDCPAGNLVRDSSIEQWSSASSPRIWSGQNVFRTRLAHSGTYAAGLGRINDRQSLLTQRMSASPNRNYRVTFWGRENVETGGLSRFTMEVEIFVYNSAGRLIGRVDPNYSPDAIPNNTYQNYDFTTGVLPGGTAEMELRFVFRPRVNNDNTVIIDDVTVNCIR